MAVTGVNNYSNTYTNAYTSNVWKNVAKKTTEKHGEITESSLAKQLRELETDGFILRHDFCEVPPRVEYTLRNLGRASYLFSIV